MDWINWPLVSGVVAIVFLVMFRKQISSVISRTSSITRHGISTDLSQSEKVERESKNNAEELAKDLDSALLRELEANITQELASRSINGEDAINLLTKYFAATGLQLDFETIYGNIFGSQLRLLRYLNQHPVGIPEELGKVFYDTANSEFPEQYKNFSFDNWMQFLYDRTLVRKDDGVLNITVKGNEYLAFLARSMKPEVTVF